MPYLKTRVPTVCALSVLLSTWGASSAAWGQGGGGTQLEEVVVTAEKREENLQDSPVSVVSMSEQQIENTSSQDLAGLMSFVPNVTFSPDASYGRANPGVNIRGVGSGLASGAATERGVGLYIDGIYYARSPGQVLSLIDVERVEVLRGPQGTLFGRNTTGGAISFYSKKPSNELEGYVDVRLGNFSERNITGMVNVPLNDQWAVRAQATDRKEDGHVKRAHIDLGNRDESAYRIQLSGAATEKLSVDLSYSFNESTYNGEPIDITGIKFPNDSLAGGVDTPLRHFGATSFLLEQAGESPFVDDDPRLVRDDFSVNPFCILDDNDPFTIGGLCENNRNSEMKVASLRVTYSINDEWELSYLSGYLEGFFDLVSDSVWTGAYARDFRQSYETYQNELQLSWTTDRIDAVAGLIHFKEDAVEGEDTTSQRINSFGGITRTPADVLAGNLIQRRDEDYFYTTTSEAAFFQMTYSVIPDKLNITGGVRYTEDTKEALITLTPVEEDPRNRRGTGEKTWTDTDWKVSVDYHINDNIMVYISQSEAYKSGIAQDNSIENGAFGLLTPEEQLNIPIAFSEPEEVVSSEVGLRSELFNNRLRFNLTYFDQDWQDRQTSLNQLDAFGLLIVTTINSPDITMDGFEADMLFAATDELTLSSSIGTNNYEVLDGSGDELRGVPEKTYTLGALYATRLANGADLDGSLNYAYQGSTFGAGGRPKGDPRQCESDDYGLFNARITYTPASATWSLSAYGANLTDEVYSTGCTASSNFYTGRQNAQYTGSSTVFNEFRGRPRTFGLQFRYNFR